ncbi:hypothetical protein [Dermacoccus sp. GAS27A]|uniref:hypothetical protein n=1 Tax=Dermacoccus sp. GAS27A TaxID=3156270 RepID=UPI00383384F9
MKASPSSAVVPLLVGIVILLWFVIHAIAQPPTHPKPGPEWVHDRGSLYWTCTSDGHALIKDTDTGSTMLARDDRKCDSGG